MGLCDLLECNLDVDVGLSENGEIDGKALSTTRFSVPYFQTFPSCHALLGENNCYKNYFIKDDPQAMSFLTAEENFRSRPVQKGSQFVMAII